MFRFSRNTNEIKQHNFEDRLKFLDKTNNSVNQISAKLDGVARKAYRDEGKSYSERSPYQMLLTAFKEIQNFTSFYLTRTVNNNNILTSDNIVNTKGLAALSGFDAINKSAATGSVIVTVKAFDNDTSTLVIQNGAQLINRTNGMQYFVTMKQDFEQFHIRYNGAITLSVVQGVKHELSFTGSGEKLQTYNIGGSDIDDEFLEVYVNNVRWLRVNKLTDMHYADKTFMVRNSLQGGINIHFGTGVNGQIPKTGDTIKVLYVTSSGADGNSGANETMEFVNGVVDRQGNYVDTRNILKVMTITNLLGGYNGDTIKEIALNAGMQTPSNLVTTVDNYYAFMRKYVELQVVDVWTEPQTQSVTNMLVMPNLRSISNRRLCTYFDLEFSDFEMDSEEIETLHSNIVGNRKYQLMSALNIYNYQLIPYAICVFVKAGKFTIPEQVYQKVVTVLHNALLDETEENAQLIRASKLTKAIHENVEEISELFVKFVGNTDYINEFGDIDTQNKIINEFGDEELMAIPYFTKGKYDNVDFPTIPVKVMSKVGSQWVDINQTQS
ncbi:hypothetical protein MA9V1_030 [Chryseobacterium phage MA9V-1]|nr:hypothetical protein MA9V1_030 [Chryseobacterium phage MA9V-1]